MVYLEKPEPDGADRGRGEKRLWVVPLAPANSWTQIEGIGLLDEFPAELAVALFQWVRDALLWAGSAEPDREHLIGDARDGGENPAWLDDAKTPSALHSARVTFRKLSTRSGAVTAKELAEACALVSAWANTSGAVRTELAFAGAAARVNPTDSDLAFRAGRAARRNGRFEEAQEWFRRAVGLARRAGDDSAYASAYLGWGVLEQARGNGEKARRLFVRAWKRSISTGRTKLAAAARHYLIPLAVGDFERGIRHAIAAYKLYGATDRRIAALATDTGAFLNDHSHFAAAQPLLEAALPHLAGSPDRFVPLGNLARAVAALGDRNRFAEIWKEASSRGSAYGETVPDALLEIAEGARTLGLIRKAEATVSDALELARERRDVEAVRRAEQLLMELHTKPPDRDIAVSPEVARFVRRFTRRLRKQAASG